MDMKNRLTKIFGITDGATPDEASRKSSVEFVRGRAQLSLGGMYEGTPQGHLISAKEAFDNYGLEVLEEAVENGSAPLLKEPNAAGNAIRRQRQSLGLTMKQAASYTALDVATMKHIEGSSGRDRVTVQELQRVAFKLGLDEAQIAYQGLAGDTAVAARLRSMRSAEETTRLTPNTVLTFTEAASVIRAQHRLMNSLGVHSAQRFNFVPDGYYGNGGAWRVGQELSKKARDILELGHCPVKSMRELVEDKLGIPVIQAELSQKAIAGATISVADGDEIRRGIVLNLKGANDNPLVRRATIAHELAHLLYDPDEYLNTVRVDTYEGLESDPTSTPYLDDEYYRVEQRANAFAISFLAALEEVHDMTLPPFSGEDVRRVVSKYGISVTAASYHVVNAHFRQYDYPRDVTPDRGDDWRGVENFTVDFLPISTSTPVTRRGRFARLVVEACKNRLISTESAAEYLCCTVDDVQSRSHMIA